MRSPQKASAFSGNPDHPERVEQLEQKVSSRNQLLDSQQENLRLKCGIDKLESETELVCKQLAAFHAYVDLTERMEIVGKAATVEAVSGMVNRALSDTYSTHDADDAS